MLLLSDTKKLIRVIIGFEPFQPTNKNIKKIFFFKRTKRTEKSYLYQKIIIEKIRQIECGFFCHCYLTVFMQIAKPKPQNRQKQFMTNKPKNIKISSKFV